MDKEMNLPTPAELVKQVREETMPLSLRVKESTYVAFDKMAQDAGVKIGTMVNSLLDYYARNYYGDGANVPKDVMAQYLNSEKFWKALSELSSEELIYRLNVKGLVWPLMDDFDSAHQVAQAYKKNYDFWICPEIPNDVPFDIRIGEEIKCYDDGADEHYFLDVTREQWPLVSVMIVEYGRKYKKLFPESIAYMTPRMLQKIAEKCKKYQKADGVLATQIKNVLLEFVEAQDD